MQLREDPLWGALPAQVNHGVPKHLPRYLDGPLMTLLQLFAQIASMHR